jgi:integrase
MTARLTYKFYTLAIEASKPTASVYLRLIVARQKAEINTGVRVKPSDWDEQRQRARRNPRANEELAFWENRLLELKRDAVVAGEQLSARILKDRLRERGDQSPKLLDFFRHRVERVEQRIGEYSINSFKALRLGLRSLEGFLASERLLNLPLGSVDAAFLAAYDQYLATKVNTRLGRPMGRNSINLNHKLLSRVLNVALRQELIHRNPYTTFRLKSERTTRTFLTREELLRIEALELHDRPDLQQCRDFFLFSVYTGLRYGDVTALTLDKLETDVNHTLWLRLTQAKTGDHIRIPLLAKASQILDRYANADFRQISGRLLPPMSNSYINTLLKELGSRAELTRPLTHHVARHTFATTITLANEIPIEVVSKWLGHRDLASTQVYAKITDGYLGKMATRLNETLG